MLLSWPTQVTLGAFALTCYIGVIWANALVGCLGRCGAQDSSTIFSSGNSVEWTTIGLIFPPPLDIESSARPLKLRSFPPLGLAQFFLIWMPLCIWQLKFQLGFGRGDCWYLRSNWSLVENAQCSPVFQVQGMGVIFCWQRSRSQILSIFLALLVLLNSDQEGWAREYWRQ